MSYYPIKLDKIRNIKFGMRAIDRIEKKYGKPIMEIEGIQTGQLAMNDYATIIWAGLAHEDDELTPDKVMDLVDEYSNLPEASKIMWEALNSTFGSSAKAEETEEKNEQMTEKVKKVKPLPSKEQND